MHYTGVSMDVIIFDWDDTICPSEFLMQRGITAEKIINKEPIIFDEKEREYLESIENSIISIIKSLPHALFYIVTNAQKGWVELTAEFLFPKLADIITSIDLVSLYGIFHPDKRVTIISARQENPLATIYDYTKWKYDVYIKIVEKTDIQTFIGIGDAPTDREAIKWMDIYFSNSQKRKTSVKSVKFKEQPTLYDVCSQCKFIKDIFLDILKYDDKLDIIMKIENYDTDLSKEFATKLVQAQKKLESDKLESDKAEEIKHTKKLISMIDSKIESKIESKSDTKIDTKIEDLKDKLKKINDDIEKLVKSLDAVNGEINTFKTSAPHYLSSAPLSVPLNMESIENVLYQQPPIEERKSDEDSDDFNDNNNVDEVDEIDDILLKMLPKDII